MKKRNYILTAAMSVILAAGALSVQVQAAPGQLAKEQETASETETVQYSISEEDLDRLLDFIREKWDSGDLTDKKKIEKAIKDGEKAFSVNLDETVEKQIAEAIDKLSSLGLDHDFAIDLAKKLYLKYGDRLAENFEETARQYETQAAESVKSAVNEQLVEPAKEAVKEAAGNTARQFFADLKDTVISFFGGLIKK